MKRTSPLLSLVALGLAVAGCDAGMLGGIFPTPSPSTWWEEAPAQVSLVGGPTTARLNVPVELTARVIIGSGSCNRFKAVSATVQEASRTIVVRARREDKKSSGALECTSDYGSKLATMSVTLAATGSYQVVAENFWGAAFTPDETPRASYDLVITP